MSTLEKLAENKLACERLAWHVEQTGKIQEMLEVWESWQWNDITDTELIEKTGAILFSDYPKKVVDVSLANGKWIERDRK